MCMNSLHTWHERQGQGAAHLKALTILFLAMTFLAMTATLMKTTNNYAWANAQLLNLILKGLHTSAQEPED